jgi:cell division protein FtsL
VIIPGLQRINIKQLLLLLVFWLLTIASALSVVYVTHDTRLKYHQLEMLKQEQNQLQVVWGQYLLEESTWSTYSRIEQIAKDDLKMEVPTASHVVIVGL